MKVGVVETRGFFPIERVADDAKAVYGEREAESDWGVTGQPPPENVSK